MKRLISDNYVTGDNVYLRELQNFFFECLGMMSITHYGAVGNGIVDNYGPLQVAIDDANRRGLRYIYVPYGRFIYTGELQNQGDIKFMGNSKSKIVNIRTGVEIPVYQFFILGDNYYTKTEADDRYVNIDGDTMTGDLHVNGKLSQHSSTATGDYAAAWGAECEASGSTSHAEGYRAKATNNDAHAEGNRTTASGIYGSHAEGNGSVSSGHASHAEGYYTVASDSYAHAEGHQTTASGYASHAEGTQTEATQIGAHAGGIKSRAIGYYSFAHGRNCEATLLSQFAIGIGNIIEERWIRQY